MARERLPALGVLFSLWLDRGSGCWGPLSVAAWVYDLGVHTALGGTMKHWTFGITPSAHRVRTVKHVPIPKADICEAPGGDCWRNAVIVINLMPEPHQTLRS